MLDTMRRDSPSDPIRDSRLIQRLDRPRRPLGPFKDNPFSFGGGYKNGGLSDEAMDVLRQVFSFDYMGAAEFEWGIVPACLNFLAKNADDLVATKIQVRNADVAKPWGFKGEVPEGNTPVFILGFRDDLLEIERRIRSWVRGKEPDSCEWDGKMRLKEETRINSSILIDTEYPSRVAGWLELDNGFFFFTDEDMWRNTAAIFGVEV